MAAGADAGNEDNGCLLVVPGSHDWPILYTQPANTRVRITDVTVPVPAGQHEQAGTMAR